MASGFLATESGTSSDRILLRPVSELERAR